MTDDRRPMTVNLSYSSQGNGRPLIIMHGLMGSQRNWLSIAKKLAEKFHVYNLDMRNHGASPWSEDTSYKAMAEDVRLFMQNAGIEKAIVMGHSMGGKVAMMLALLYPELVEKLIAVDIAPVKYVPAMRTNLEAMAKVDLTSVQKRADADAQLAEYIQNASTRYFLLQNLILEDGKASWRANLTVLLRDLDNIADFPDTASLGKYLGPTLFVAGEKSYFITKDYLPAIRLLFPNFLLKTIPGAGHLVHIEKPAEFITAIEQFCR